MADTTLGPFRPVAVHPLKGEKGERITGVENVESLVIRWRWGGVVRNAETAAVFRAHRRMDTKFDITGYQVRVGILSNTHTR